MNISDSISKLGNDRVAAKKNYRDALCGTQMVTFNRALCDYYGRHCSEKPSCPPPDGEIARKQMKKPCADLQQNCLSWARSGECERNPGFMETECAQSCAACGEGHAVPFLGAPTSTCFDSEHHAECESLKSLGACTSQRSYMQEACRRTCELCNASKDAFPGGKEPERDDTAAHACPDGSDLGGGEVLIKSEDPKQVAAEVDGGLADAERRLLRNAEAEPTAFLAEESGAAGVVGQPIGNTDLSKRQAGHVGARSETALLGMEPLPSWPLLLAHGSVLLLLGYFFRGYVDDAADGDGPN
eukprot:CAMPEP_0174705222 /NCGR_PEP_ID=MMETSP1094-20130205/8526_1 /TAXON_ID=156173 /ORGANISM="Chrysochromulina brevifilum, Strain UTEX LB 985" /LENGTH=299 /DNA_ID=CAMNT_0015903357 /DNA_START=111 /DNA_END=1011 /DNA_ORIENTATION=+